jgi:hypothetical protein
MGSWEVISLILASLDSSNPFLDFIHITQHLFETQRTRFQAGTELTVELLFELPCGLPSQLPFEPLSELLAVHVQTMMVVKGLDHFHRRAQALS